MEQSCSTATTTRSADSFTETDSSRLSSSDGNTVDDLPSVPEEDSFEMQKSYDRSIFALCVCMLVHGWLLVSVFPYSGFLAIHLIPELDEETAGSYAGLIASSFMAGRTLTSYGWGQIADVYGRRFVLFASLLWSALISLLFGLSPSFRSALWWRFLLGVGNGILGTTKTSISELAFGNEKLETKGMGMVMGMWGWSFLVSPALSGALADPLRQYPDSFTVKYFEDILGPFPFVLPNLVSVVFCLIGVLAMWAFVPETLPKNKLRHPRHIPADVWMLLSDQVRRIVGNDNTTANESPNSSKYGSIATAHEKLDGSENDRIRDCQHNHYNQNEMMETQLNHSESCSLLATSNPTSVQVTQLPSRNHQDDDDNDKEKVIESATISSLWSQRTTRNHLVTTWIYSFVAVSLDEAFPLFCISQDSGLGLTETTIGKILSGCGLIFAITQYYVYSSILQRFGLLDSLRIGAICSGPLLTLIPLSLWFNSSDNNDDGDSEMRTNNNNDGYDDHLTWSAYTYLVLLLATYRVFSMVFFSSIAVATNRTVLPSHRATMNGLSTLGGSITKGLAPSFAGFLVAFSVSSKVIPHAYGGSVIFGTIGLLGCATAIMTFRVLDVDGSSSKKGNDIYPDKK